MPFQPVPVITPNMVQAFGSSDLGPRAQLIADASNELFPVYGINTRRRARYFMAQSAFETQGFTKFEEVLVYTSPDRIAEVWPTRFYFKGVAKQKKYGGRYVELGRGPLNAEEYASNPEKLSNEVYGNRYGNGPVSTGDGWRYRGRGDFHLTFKDNYRQCSRELYGDQRLVDDPDLVLDMHCGKETALWFWNTRGLSDLADADRFTDCTNRINGSTVTVPERLPILRIANQVIV